MIPRAEERAKTIILKAGDAFHEEGRCGATAISPGMLIEIDAANSSDVPRTPEVVQPHSTAGETTPVRIAVEDRLRAKLWTDDYAEDDIVPYKVLRKGDVFMGRVADEFVGTEGAPLKSNGDGTFVAQGGTGTIIAECEEDIDYSVDPPPADRVLLARMRVV